MVIRYEYRSPPSKSLITNLIQRNDIAPSPSTSPTIITSSTMTDITASIPSWPYLYASWYSVTLLGISISSFTPAVYSVCEQAGFPQPRNQPINVYVYLLAGSQLLVGLAVAVLEAVSEWKAVSVIISCTIPMGLIGTSLAATKGGMGLGRAFWAHGLATVIASLAAWNLVQDNW